MKLIILELFIILMLFLRELGLPRYLYEQLYTHPKTRVLISIFGDIIYGIGMSVDAAVIYAYFVEESFYLTAFIVGLAFCSVGAYLRK